MYIYMHNADSLHACTHRWGTYYDLEQSFHIANMSHLVSNIGVLSSCFSDHLVTFWSRRITKDRALSSITKKVRSFKNYSKASFTAALSRVDWSSVVLARDIDHSLSEFHHIFLSVTERVAPLREVRVKAKSNPWMNSIILTSIKKRDLLFSRFRKDTNNVELCGEYC